MAHIGSSETAAVCGVEKFGDTRMMIYHKKVGSEPEERWTNELVFHGKQQESYNAFLWSHYDGPGDGYVHNAEAGKVIRKCRNLHGMIVNPKYPFLSCNVDRVSVAGSQMLNSDAGFSGKISDDPFIVEMKNINFFYEKSLESESGFPNSYVYQAMQQMIVTETDYSEIAMFIGGNSYKVAPVYRDNHICQEILDKGSDFWNLVKIGRKWYQLYLEAISLGDNEKAQECLAQIYTYEPDPGASKRDADYLSGRHGAEEGSSIMADDSTYELAIQHRKVSGLKKAIEESETLLANKLRYLFVQNRVEKINLPNGQLKYTLRKGGVNKTLTNSAPKPDEREVAIMKELVLKESKVDISLLES